MARKGTPFADVKYKHEELGKYSLQCGTIWQNESNGRTYFSITWNRTKEDKYNIPISKAFKLAFPNGMKGDPEGFFNVDMVADREERRSNRGKSTEDEESFMDGADEEDEDNPFA